ncbi:16S rRNA (guanine(966)-N(2))-methyltransferase RsmD [Kocuria atrinae]|uniref:RsmD family RNA methyltransferase n=1 Tax=Kocuria atrinae TaxID=592377 RepID=A0ABP5J1W7_9MICC|nr:16S rRNA (guanine(966)-N(2))-methyltransferase RsmD [Kocuria sp.]
MTRIISGAAGGLRIKSVPGSATRPTTDRVKESLFARLEAWGMCEDARVLDLFAGSGALGLEAASRGAREVTLVEKANGAASVCRANAQVLAGARPDIEITTVQSPVATFLTRLGSRRWDLVLVDPPYPLPNEDLTALLGRLVGHLGPGAVIVVERSARTEEPTWPEGLQRLEHTTHGETVLWYVEETPGEESAAEHSEDPQSV